jgi:hypothetical protein
MKGWCEKEMARLAWSGKPRDVGLFSRQVPSAWARGLGSVRQGRSDR